MENQAKHNKLAKKWHQLKNVHALVFYSCYAQASVLPPGFSWITTLLTKNKKMLITITSVIVPSMSKGLVDSGMDVAL